MVWRASPAVPPQAVSASHWAPQLGPSVCGLGVECSLREGGTHTPVDTGPKSRISQRDNESDRCAGSSRLSRPNDSSRLTGSSRTCFALDGTWRAQPTAGHRDMAPSLSGGR